MTWLFGAHRGGGQGRLCAAHPTDRAGDIASHSSNRELTPAVGERVDDRVSEQVPNAVGTVRLTELELQLSEPDCVCPILIAKAL